MSAIVVQEVVTTWTKNERGGQAAAERNTTPEAFTLPDIAPISYPMAVLHDKVTFEAGMLHIVTVDEFTPQKKFRYGCISISWDESVVAVTYAYTRSCGGAPERASYPRKVLTLSSGSWGRVLYNGRFVYSEGDWIYRKTVFNIGYVYTIASGLFQMPPYRVFSDMAASGIGVFKKVNR